MKKSITLILKAQISSFGSIDIRLQGRCMEPFLVAGDMARIFHARRYKKGDLCLVELDRGYLVLHRIIDIQGEMIILKGDYSGLSETQKTEDIVGVAKLFKLKGLSVWRGYAQRFYSRRVDVFLSRRLLQSESGASFRPIQSAYRKLVWNRAIRARNKLAN